MADLQVREPQSQAPKPDVPALIEQALDIIRSTPQPRTEEEVVRRLQQIKEPLTGVPIPRRERRGLDGALLLFALNEPGGSPRTWKLRREIIHEITPRPRISNVRRDKYERVIEPKPLPPLTEEEILLLSVDKDDVRCLPHCQAMHCRTGSCRALL